jgi:hypothetical protein
MAAIIDGSLGITTPGVVNTAGETIATTLVVTGVTTLTGGLNAALPVLSGGTGVTTKTGTGAVVLGTSPTLATPTFDSAQLPTVSGTAPLYMCRAWVNFNGTGTVAIRASGNVSSITDTGVGNYTVNLTTAMPDVNGVLLNGKSNQVSNAGNAVGMAWTSTSTFSTVVYEGGSAVDAANLYFAVFR